VSLRAIPIVTALVLSACTPARGGGSGGREGTAPLDRPTGPVGLEEARRYVLGLVNRDRAEADLPPVERDEVAERAGQRHVDDMVKNGFTAHWGTDGSVPEQRYTESGGVHFAQENAACFFDGTARELDPNPTFSPDQLEQIESAFVHETPPNDGHRKNILKKWHNKLGVGLGKPVGIEQPCMAQEFVDEYGEYDGLPQRATLGQKISVAGEIHAPAEFGGVGLARIEPAKKLGAAHLNGTSSYPVPNPDDLYFPAGFKTPKPVKLEGKRFSIDLDLRQPAGPGRYQVSVWGRYPGDKAFVMVSLRTIDVR
jgi:hypothetical protein